MSLNILPDYEVLVNGSAITYISVDYEKEPRDVGSTPKFKIVIPNRFGIHKTDYLTGADVEIKRNTITVFKGTIEPRSFEMNESGSTMTIEGLNTYYRILTNYICDSYDFIESAQDYGVTVNPYKFEIYKSVSPSIPFQDVTLVGPPIYGYRHDEVMKHLIGEKFLFAHKFNDLSYLLPATTKGPANYAQVYRNNNFTDQTTPRLQLTPSGNGTYNTSGTVESVPLMNGDPNIDVMGQLNNCRVRLYGVIPSGCSVQVQVCRNGGQSYSRTNNFLTSQKPSRNWINVNTFNSGNQLNQTLLYTDRFGVNHTASQNVLTVPYWEETISFSGSESHKNSLAYKLILTGNGSTTPYIEYIHFDCNTTSDTGIVSGTINTYTDTSSIAGSDFFEGNMESNRRLEGIRDVRLSTINVTDPLSHFWDAWINTSGQLNFMLRRGSDITSPIYSFDTKKFQGIEYDFDGSDIWWKCVAYGAGSGEFRTRLVSDEEYSSGGLKSSSVKSTYNNAARIGRYDDTSATTTAQLLRKARATFKLHQQPFETLRIPSGLIPQSQAVFDVGDSIRVQLTDLSIDKQFPVESLAITVDGNGENTKVTLGEPLKSLASAVTSLFESNQEVYVVRQPSGQSTGVTGAGTFLDNTHYGIYTFGISEPENIKKVAFKAVTVPFDGTVKAGNFTAQSTNDGESAEYFNDHIITFEENTSVNTASTSVIANVQSVSPAVGTYNGVVVTGTVLNGLSSTQTYNWSIVNTSTSTTLASGTHSSVASGFLRTVNYSFTAAQVAAGHYVEFRITSGSLGTQAGAVYPDGYVKLVVQSRATHTHTVSAQNIPLTFGIYIFSGDSDPNPSNPGNGPAIYGSSINFWIDPTNETTPEGSTQLPIGNFGNPSAASEIDEFDITSWLKRDANGVITRGLHKIFVKSSGSASNNSRNLGKIQIAILEERKTA